VDEVCEVLVPPAGGDDGGGAGGDEDEVEEDEDEDGGRTTPPRGVPLGTGEVVVPLGCWVDELPGWKMSFCAPSWKLYRLL